MGSPATATPGTLSEYDIILSISAEAINRQFQLLYDKPILQDLALPPPPGMVGDGAASPPPSRYLINHDLEIHIASQRRGGALKIDYDAGIVGHIKCPKIRFDGCMPGCARVSLTFERVDELRSMIINGYTVSWEVKLDQFDIQDIVSELIHLALDTKNPTVMHSETIQALEEVPNEHFTVASIFCICEAAQIAESFELRDEHGKKTDRDMQRAFMFNVAGYFSILQSKIPPGRSTPDHAFVFGYGLCQRLNATKDINPNVKTDPTPNYFVPKEYRVTVTPGNPSYTNGTLNFCILTKREQNAQELGNSFFIDIEKIFQTSMLKGNESHLEGQSKVLTGNGSPPTWSKRQDIEFGSRVSKTVMEDMQYVKGYSEVIVSWETNPDIESKDARRQAQITICSNVVQDFEYVNTGWSSKVLTAHIDMGYKYVFDVSTGTGGLINVTKNELKTVFPERGQNGHLKLVKRQRGNGEYGAFVTTTSDTSFETIWIGRISEALHLPEGLHNALLATTASLEYFWADNMSSLLLTEFEDKWKTNVNSLGNKVIMPAGNVFNFSGVDVDSQGNMYVHVSYAFGAEDVSQNQDVEGGDDVDWKALETEKARNAFLASSEIDLPI